MILMNDFKAESDELREAMLDAAKRVIDSGWYILGNESSSFEQLWAKVCGTRYAVGVGNGMDAIEIILRGLNIGKDDEVITTPMTAFATVLAILRAGATPVLADIDPDTGLLSIDSVQRCLSKRTKAVVLVHLYGQVRKMDDWTALCSNHGIYLVEDCAQAHLASSNGKVAGSFGIAGAYSFYPTKNLGALGDAGIIVTQDEMLSGRASRLRNYGQSIRYHHPELGMNSRLDEIHAAMLSVRFNWLPKFTEQRRHIAQEYRASLNNPLVQQLAEPEDMSAHVYHLFVVMCAQRDKLQAHLRMQGVQSLIHYPVPVHQQIPCKALKCDPRGLKITEKYAEQCLSLPCHPQMKDMDIAQVITAVNSFKGT